MSVYYDIPKPPEVRECPHCGRELPSHHLGCVHANKPPVAPAEPEVDTEEVVGPDEVDSTEVAVCQQDGCQDAPKPYGGRGPRPKYCAAHGK